MVMNPNTIVRGERYFMQMYGNLKNNPMHPSMSGKGLHPSIHTSMQQIDKKFCFAK